MSKYIISPCSDFNGSIKVSGSKNASLPIMAAALLSDDTSELYDVPILRDTENMESLIRKIGGKIEHSKEGNLKISFEKVRRKTAPVDAVNCLRASFLIMGPCLARFGKIRIPMPGGCQIGARPIDLHLKGFSAMGAKIKQGHGYVEATCPHLEGAQIYLDFPSVGATENLLMAATLAKGETVIQNAATEPEVFDLCRCLENMGAKIEGAGTDTIKIKGQKHLNGCKHTIIPDRIEAGTFLAAAAICRGTLKLQNVLPEHLQPLLAKMNEMGINAEVNKTSIKVEPCEKLKAVDIKTLPYPGFPTDMQAQLMALMSVAEGTGVIVETIFENRFMQVPELCRMGANIKTDGRCAVINGTKRLSGTQVKATDLRAGASLVIAALNASGETEISDIEHIERGYENFENKLRSVGVQIERED